MVWSLWENSHCFFEVGDSKQVSYVRDLKIGLPSKQPKQMSNVEQKEDRRNNARYQTITHNTK